MQILEKIILSKTEPPSTNCVWIKPIGDSVAIYCFDGYWKPATIVDGNGTISPYDDIPYTPGGGEVGPNTVGTDEIIDGSVQEADLNKEVSDRLHNVYVDNEESLYINGTKPE